MPRPFELSATKLASNTASYFASYFRSHLIPWLPLLWLLQSAPLHAQQALPQLPQNSSLEENSGTSSSVVNLSSPVPPGSTPSNPSFIADASYILGSGDKLFISFFNVPEYDGEKQIGVDGALNLPLVGKLSISGLTIAGASQAISNAYAPYLKTPLVTVDLVAPRAMQIGISGEVNQPGAYDIQLVGETTDATVEWPTVVEAIQLAGGITNRADVRAVEIRRLSGSGAGVGQSQVIRLNLWELLTTGNIQNDITLRYGDAINIPTATSLSAEELTTLSAANFSPEAIRVTVVGEVTQPGAVDIAPNAPLNQALLAAGGFDPTRADTDVVELVRLNPDGTVSQRPISVSFDQGVNEETNPALQNNDVVVVSRSGRATFSDNVNGTLGPVGTILSPFRLLFDIFDIFD
ncbi:MAG: SLBB domain-containing protein [Cyanobacteria bacterium J06650_10]